MIDAMVEKMVCEDLHKGRLADDVYTVSATDSTHRRLALNLAMKVWPRGMFAIVAEMDVPLRFQADLITAMGDLLRDGGQAGG
jgi:hypothetical protein